MMAAIVECLNALHTLQQNTPVAHGHAASCTYSRCIHPKIHTHTHRKMSQSHTHTLLHQSQSVKIIKNALLKM